MFRDAKALRQTGANDKRPRRRAAFEKQAGFEEPYSEACVICNSSTPSRP
jgi:hypothetical protein